MARAKKHASGEAAKAEKEPEAATPETDAASSNVAKGDIAWIDYEGWVVSPNGTRSLFDTTRAELAKKEDKFDEKKVYAEFPVVVGHGRLTPGLDEALLGAEIGKPQEVKIPPEKGAGERDPKLVELHPLRGFLKQEIHPEGGVGGPSLQPPAPGPRPAVLVHAHEEGRDAGGAPARDPRDGLRPLPELRHHNPRRGGGRRPPGHLQDGRAVVRLEVPRDRGHPGAARGREGPVRRGGYEAPPAARAREGGEGGGG